MLTGVGPKRAFEEKVTHVLYLTQVTDGIESEVLRFDDLHDRLRSAQVYHTTHLHDGETYVSISCPAVPRNYSSERVVAAYIAMQGATENEAKDSVVEFCKQCAVSNLHTRVEQWTNNDA